MPAVNYDLLIEQGTTWSVTVTLKKTNQSPFDLTGYTGRCQIRKTYTSTNILASPTVTIPSGTDGKVVLSLTEAQTSSLPDTYAVYDVELVAPNGDVTRILQGKVKVSLEVTRPLPEPTPLQT